MDSAEFDSDFVMSVCFLNNCYINSYLKRIEFNTTIYKCFLNRQLWSAALLMLICRVEDRIGNSIAPYFMVFHHTLLQERLPSSSISFHLLISCSAHQIKSIGPRSIKYNRLYASGRGRDVLKPVKRRIGNSIAPYFKVFHHTLLQERLPSSSISFHLLIS